MMTREDMMSALKDINRLKNFVNGGYLNAIGRPNGENEENPNIDKFGRGFNKDDRFNACSPHTIRYNSWKGTYGNSGSTSILSIGSEILFWRCFDQYLNQRQDEILNAVADLMQIELQKNIDVLKDERDRINNVIEELTKGVHDDQEQ